MKGIIRFLLYLNLIIIFRVSLAQENPLANGSWLKYTITESGMYKIQASELEVRGMMNLPSNQLRILSLPGGPLPQANSSVQPAIITDLPLLVEDGGDGIFNGNDFAVFYAEGPDVLRYEEGELLYIYNNYDRANYIYVGFNGLPGQRISTRTPVASGGSIINT